MQNYFVTTKLLADFNKTLTYTKKFGYCV